MENKFIEVTLKGTNNTKYLVNLINVTKIHPIADGGTHIQFNISEQTINVSEEYEEIKKKILG